MAFKHDPVFAGLGPRAQATSTPKAGFARPVPPRPTPPAGPPTPTPTPTRTPEARAEECRVEYTNFRVYAQERERRLQWLAGLSGVAGLGIGLAIGAWQGSLRAARALPEPE